MELVVDLQRLDAQPEDKTHIVRDVSTKDVTELQRCKSQIGLQFKQSKSKIQYLEQRQRIKDVGVEKQVVELKERTL